MARLPLSIETVIKRNVATLKCPTHSENAKITFTEQGFQVSCCCEDFRQYTIEKCHKIVGDAIHNDITKHIKKVLR